ncbi:MAG: hypothetical protein ACTSQJ_19485, partial [Promethearchaeota archaeon]
FVDKVKEEQMNKISELEQRHTTEFQEKIDKYLKQIEDLKMQNIENIEKLRQEKIDAIEKLKNQHLKEIQELKDEKRKVESILMESKLLSSEKGSEAKSLAEQLEDISKKHEELIKQIEDLKEQNRYAQKDIENLNKIIENLSEYKRKNSPKITYFDKLSVLMEQEPLFKTFLIVMDVGAITKEDLQKALGIPIVMVNKHIQQLEEIDLLEINEIGKITLKSNED